MILRAVKVFGLIDYMHFLMNIISKSISSFILLALSLVLLIVIYSLLGMQIFTVQNDNNHNFQSFSTFSEAFIRVFDLITLDNWYRFTQSVIEGQDDTFVFLRVSYVISLIIICNFLMLNFFIDLLCQHFENVFYVKYQENEKKQTRKKLSRSTRQSTTKTKIKMFEEELNFDDENLSSLSSFDEENFYKLMKKMFVSAPPLAPNKSANSSDLEQKNNVLLSILQDSITRRISQDHLSKDSQSNFQPNDDNLMENFDKSLDLSAESILKQKKNESNIVSRLPQIKSDEMDISLKHRKAAKSQSELTKFLKSVLKNFEVEDELAYFKDVKCQFSLYIFSKENKIRRICFKIMFSRLFKYLMNFIIFLSLLKLIIDTYIDWEIIQDKDFLYSSNILNYMINISFFSEVLIKMIALGFFMDGGSYLRNILSILEFLNSLGFVLQLITNLELLKVILKISSINNKFKGTFAFENVSANEFHLK